MATITEEELREQRETAKAVLIASYQMYEKSIADMLEKRKGNPMYSEKETEKNLKLMQTMQQDVVQRFVELGFTEDEIKNSVKKGGKKKGIDRSVLEGIMKRETARDEMAEYVEKMKEQQENSRVNDNRSENESELNEYINNSNKKEEKKVNFVNEEIETISLPNKEDVDKKAKQELKERDLEQERKQFENEETETFGSMKLDVDKKQMFGVVKLPSKGECYKNKIKELRVSYLTAYDENMILSPNLYKEGEFLEYIAKNKILDDINVDDLVQGDIEAVIIWLRGTGYGNDYPIIVTDPDTGKEFETSVDLTELKYKKFTLKGDENGYFDFVTPNTKDKIKFKILTNGDNKFLQKLKVKESNKVRIMMLRKYTDELLNAINGNNLVDDDLNEKIVKSVNEIQDEIISKFDESKDLSFIHELTDRLILQTVSINGITDRKYINDYIVSMNIKDASEYRKYVIENTPGINYNIKVERPKSLGGGSVDTFLRLDQFIFVNI